MLRRSLLLALPFLGACPDDDCPCTRDPFVFEVSGQGENMVIRDASGAEVDGLSIDVADCDCADHVKIRLTNTDGNLLDPPAESACVLKAPSKRATTLEIAVLVGDECDVDWNAVDSQPPVPLPIKVRP